MSVAIIFFRTSLNFSELNEFLACMLVFILKYFIIYYFQLRFMMKSHAFVRENFPKVLSYDSKGKGHNYVLFIDWRWK